MDPVTVTSSLYAALLASPVAGMSFVALRVVGRLPWWGDLLAALALGTAAFAGAYSFCREQAAASFAESTMPRSYQAMHQDGHWHFLHPGSGHHVADELWAERGVALALELRTRADRPVRFVVPALRIAELVVPGRAATVRLVPQAAGDHAIADVDPTGDADAGTAPATLHVVDAAAFAAAPWRR